VPPCARLRGVAGRHAPRSLSRSRHVVKVTKLVLDDVAFPTAATCARLVLSFPNLETLAYSQVTFARRGFDPHVFPRSTLARLKLARLVFRKRSRSLQEMIGFLGNASVGIFEVYIGAPRGRRDPQHIDWYIEDIETSGTQSLMQGLGALRRLYGSVILDESSTLFPQPSDVERRLDLSHNVQLEEIELNMKTEHECAGYAWLTRSLATGCQPGRCGP